MSANPVRMSDAAELAVTANAGAMTDEESDEIRQRLRALGYLG